MIRVPVEIIVTLEKECLKVDGAIAQRKWDVCEASWRTQRVLQHELDIALREYELSAEESAGIKKRIDRLTKYRDAQLKRLKAFNDACASRLANMSKFRSFSKNVNKERRASLLDVTQ